MLKTIKITKKQKETINRIIDLDLKNNVLETKRKSLEQILDQIVSSAWDGENLSKDATVKIKEVNAYQAEFVINKVVIDNLLKKLDKEFPKKVAWGIKSFKDFLVVDKVYENGEMTINESNKLNNQRKGVMSDAVAQKLESDGFVKMMSEYVKKKSNNVAL